MNHYFLGICIVIGSIIIAINQPNIKFPTSCTVQPMKIFIGNGTSGISTATVTVDGNNVTSNLDAGYSIRCF